jgi:hypothetical protein
VLEIVMAHSHCTWYTLMLFCLDCTELLANRFQCQTRAGLRPRCVEVTCVCRSLLAALRARTIPRFKLPGEDGDRLG